jgi:hypothetical protein
MKGNKISVKNALVSLVSPFLWLSRIIVYRSCENSGISDDLTDSLGCAAGNKARKCLGTSCEYYEGKKLENYGVTFKTSGRVFGSKLEPNFDLTSYRFS